MFTQQIKSTEDARPAVKMGSSSTHLHSPLVNTSSCEVVRFARTRHRERERDTHTHTHRAHPLRTRSAYKGAVRRRRATLGTSDHRSRPTWERVFGDTDNSNNDDVWLNTEQQQQQQQQHCMPRGLHADLPGLVFGAVSLHRRELWFDRAEE